MRNLIIATVGAAMFFVLSGCGSLNQTVGGPQMSEPAIEFAKQMPADSSLMSIPNGEKYLTSNKWASKVYPIFPVFYWSTLGNFNPEPNYGVRTTTIIFPLFVVTRSSVYDDAGKRLHHETTFNMDLVIGYEDTVRPSGNDFKAGILWIPGIGPFLGIGPEFFQFFWVPFTDFK